MEHKLQLKWTNINATKILVTVKTKEKHRAPVMTEVAQGYLKIRQRPGVGVFS